MEKILDSYKNYFPIIVLIFYAFGYVYLNRFYSNFDIKIENYITLSDILFLTINTLVKISIIFIIAEIILMFTTQLILSQTIEFFNRKKIKKNAKESEYDSEKTYKFHEENIRPIINKYFNGFSLLILTLIIYGLIKLTEEYLIILSISSPFWVLKLYLYISGDDNSKEEKKGLVNFFTIFIGIVFIICFGIWGYSDGKIIKNKEYESLPIEFYENSKLYSTINSSLKYVGETSSYLFLFDVPNRKTLLFNKKNIKSMSIIDPDVSNEKFDEKVKEKSKEFEKKIKNIFPEQ